jgi:hypothetical protein
MADRITQRDIDGALRGLNLWAGLEPHEADGTAYRYGEGGAGAWIIGRYYVMGAYGGWQLVQVINEHGGVRAVSGGYVSRRELLAVIRAYREGMAAGREADRYAVATLRASVEAARA